MSEMFLLQLGTGSGLHRWQRAETRVVCKQCSGREYQTDDSRWMVGCDWWPFWGLELAEKHNNLLVSEGLGRLEVILYFLGGYLIKRASEAVKLRPEAVSVFFDLCDGIPKDNQCVWRKMVEDWESNNTKLNPFESSFKHKCAVHWPNHYWQVVQLALTYNKARLELAKEDEDHLKMDKAGMIVDKEISPLQLITQGLKIEEIQYVRWSLGNWSDQSIKVALAMGHRPLGPTSNWYPTYQDSRTGGKPLLTTDCVVQGPRSSYSSGTYPLKSSPNSGAIHSSQNPNLSSFSDVWSRCYMSNILAQDWMASATCSGSWLSKASVKTSSNLHGNYHL